MKKIRAAESIKSTQHCTSPECPDFSHTAEWCGRFQPRRCGCAFCYGEKANP
jgi:hypothetical protein